MPRVCVVIPNYEGAHHLGECLDSLRGQSFGDLAVVIVDNGSHDGSAELIRRSYPEVGLVELGRNLGFAGGCNAGIRASASEFVLLLNNDTRADPDAVGRMVAALDDRPEAGFAASKMLRYDPPHLIDSAGDWFSIRRAVAQNIGAGAPASSLSRPAWVFGACAGGAMYRRSMLDDIGLFDEDFFYIFEDVDLDFRAQMAGYGCIYVPDAIIYHKRGISGRHPPAPVRAIALRNQIWVAGKNLPWPLLIRCAMYASVRLIRRAGWLAKLTLKGQRPYPRGWFREGRFASHIFKACATLPSKRLRTQAKRRIKSSDLSRLISYPIRPVSL